MLFIKLMSKYILKNYYLRKLCIVNRHTLGISKRKYSLISFVSTICVWIPEYYIFKKIVINFRSVVDRTNDESEDEIYRINSPTQMLLSACLRTVEKSKGMNCTIFSNIFLLQAVFTQIWFSVSENTPEEKIRTGKKKRPKRAPYPSDVCINPHYTSK